MAIMHDPFQHTASSLHSLLHFSLVLFARHWMMGLTNLGLTAFFGLGLVWIAEHWRLLGLRQQTVLQLRRGILLVALIKGAFCLVMGESLHARQGHRWIVGIQFPSPDETAGLLAQSHYSIWHPTEVSGWVSLVLGGLATMYLLRRMSQLTLARRSFNLWARLNEASTSARSGILLAQAASQMGLPGGVTLPKILEIDLPGQNGIHLTPLLLGLRQPLLILPPLLLIILTDAELELVLRHEIAHLARRDHWWRWLLLWVTDVGGLTGLVFPFKALVIEIEERLCDCWAVQSPAEALLLANVLRTVAENLPNKMGQPSIPMQHSDDPAGKSSDLVILSDHASPDKPIVSTGSCSPLNLTDSLLMAALPLLLGGYVNSWQPRGVLRGRLEGLLAWSKELSSNQQCLTWKTEMLQSQTKVPDKVSQPWSKTIFSSAVCLTVSLFRTLLMVLLSLLLFSVLYAKFHLTFNVR